MRKGSWKNSIFAKVLAAVFTTGLICALAVPSKADIPILYVSGTLTATGDTPILSLAGQSTCSMVLSGTWVGTATPKGSSDRGATYTTVSSIGAKTSNGTYSGDISAYTTNFKISWTRTSGTLGYAISCTGAVSTANVTVTAANVTVVNTPGVTIQNTPNVNAQISKSSAILTSSSATACTSISTTAKELVSITNTGAAMAVFPQFYDEGAAPTCADADLIWGDGTTLALGAGQTIFFPTALTNGLAYKLSGALSANFVLGYF